MEFRARNTRRLIFALCAIVVAAATLYLYAVQHNSEVLRRQSMSDMENALDRVATLFQSEFQSQIRHTHFIAATPPIQGIVRATQNDGLDPLENTELALWKDRLQRIFAAYARNQPHISQIRFIGIDNEGLELVRVDRRGEDVGIVPAELLQSKQDRPYFDKALALEDHGIYISPINLNRERGTVETPPTATYRIATPIRTSDGENFGLIIINFYAEPLLERLKDSAGKYDFFLMNANGDFLRHPQAEFNFAFEFGKSITWNELYPEAKLSQISRVNFGSSQSYFIASRKTQTPGTQQYFLALAESHNEIQAKVQASLYTQLILTLLFSAMLASGSLLYWQLSNKREAELEVRARFKALVEGSADAIITTDRHALILSINKTAVQLLGWQQEEAKKRHLFELIAPDQTRTELENRFNSVLSGDKKVSFELDLNHKNEAVRHVSMSFSAIASEREVYGVAAIIRDISASHELKKAMLQLNQQLKQRNEEMENFVYTVSHDLKTPLASITGFGRRLLKQNEPLSEDAERWIKRILHNAELMSQLLNDLLDLSKILQKDLERDPIVIEHCIERACEALQNQIEESGATIEVDARCPRVNANARMLTQCFQNLIANAIQYCSPERKPLIRISTQLIDGQTRIAIEDNGLGIESRHQERIFRIFERLDVGEGTGIGLAIVKAVMEKHDGRCELHSQLGRGSTFTLIFPPRN